MIKNSIGVSLIIKNEEKFLEKCLKSCKNIFDEIVIVDTGSTDNSLKIAEKFTNNIYEIKWEDDFSKARNYAKSKMKTKWLFQLDADEEIEIFNKDKFIDIVSNNKIAALFISVKNILTGRISKIDYQPRLFKNINEIFWKNRVHEQITDSLFDYCSQYNNIICNSSFSVIHFGYRPYIIKSRDKYVRNVRLLKKTIEEEEFDFYTVLKYISSLRKVELSNKEEEVKKYIISFYKNLLTKNESELRELKPVKYFPYELTHHLKILDASFIKNVLKFYEEKFNRYIEFQYLKYKYFSNVQSDMKQSKEAYNCLILLYASLDCFISD